MGAPPFFPPKDLIPRAPSHSRALQHGVGRVCAGSCPLCAPGRPASAGSSCVGRGDRRRRCTPYPPHLQPGGRTADHVRRFAARRDVRTLCGGARRRVERRRRGRGRDARRAAAATAQPGRPCRCSGPAAADRGAGQGLSSASGSCLPDAAPPRAAHRRMDESRRRHARRALPAAAPRRQSVCGRDSARQCAGRVRRGARRAGSRPATRCSGEG